jgi:hypothetical protein
VLEYESRFMDLIRYDPHLKIEKLKVKKIVFILKFKVSEKVRILMP